MMLLLLAAFVAASPSCNEYNNCTSCVIQSSGLGTCRWCPVDRVCHAYGSGFNPCTADENIKDKKVNQCPAEPRTTGFSLPDALYCMSLSVAAYSDTPWDDRSGWNKLPKTFFTNSSYFFKFPMKDIKRSQGQVVAAFIGWDTSQERIYISFRGTNPDDKTFFNIPLQIIEELVNCGAISWTQAGASVYLNKYFGLGSFGLVSLFRNTLNGLMSTMPGYSVWLTGHSLGGAMASIAAVDLVIGGLKTAARPVVYSFGAPRPGNYDFSQVFKSVALAYRVVNNYDVVPHLTPCSASCNAQTCVQGRATLCRGGCCIPDSTHGFHHPTEIWFSKGNYQNGVMCGYRECTGTNAPPGGKLLTYGEDQACSDHIEGTPSIEEHSEYWNALAAGWCNVQRQPLLQPTPIIPFDPQLLVSA